MLDPTNFHYEFTFDVEGTLVALSVCWLDEGKCLERNTGACEGTGRIVKGEDERRDDKGEGGGGEEEEMVGGGEVVEPKEERREVD